MTTQTRLMTLDEFLALPETKPYTELIDGVPCQKPVGKIRHSRAQWLLPRLLDRHPATSAGSPWPELGFKFRRTTAGNLRVPDVSYYLPGSVKPDLDEDYPETPPDLAAEVRSDGQTLRSLRERLAFLREQGSRCTLLIDPEKRTVEVHDGDRSWTASGDDEVVLEQLNGFSFKVDELFA
jgi:Uma2 family endonuclease